MRVGAEEPTAQLAVRSREPHLAWLEVGLGLGLGLGLGSGLGLGLGLGQGSVVSGQG